jgi:hypothetical protein
MGSSSMRVWSRCWAPPFMRHKVWRRSLEEELVCPWIARLAKDLLFVCGASQWASAPLYIPKEKKLISQVQGDGGPFGCLLILCCNNTECTCCNSSEA